MFQAFPISLIDQSSFYPQFQGRNTMRNHHQNYDMFDFPSNQHPVNKIEQKQEKRVDESEEEDEEILYYQHLINQKKQALAHRKEQQRKQEERRKQYYEQQIEKLKLRQQEQERQNQLKIIENKSKKLSLDNILDTIFSGFDEEDYCENKKVNTKQQQSSKEHNSNKNFVSQSVNKRSYFDENGNKIVITTTLVNQNGQKSEKTIKQIYDKNDLNKCIEENETQNLKPMEDQIKSVKNLNNDLQQSQEKESKTEKNLNNSKHEVVIEDEQSGDQIIIAEK